MTIRSHILGQREMVEGCVMHHTYNFYEEDGVEDMRILEVYIDSYDSKAYNDPKLYREFVSMVDSKNKFPVSVYVDGKQFNNRHHARSLYKMLLGMGYTPYTS